MGSPHTLAVLLLGLGACMLLGCAENQQDIEPHPAEVRALLAADADMRAEAVRRDPVAYLHHVADRCRELEQYTLRFTRYERRGLLRKLYGPEDIECRFRREPFSVHMKWLDEDLKYYESTYVEGQEGNRVRFVTRWWSPPLLPPPGVNKVGLQTPVVWGESKHPLSDFGLERLMERTLNSLHEADEDVVVTYEGLFRLPQTDSDVHHLHLAYPESFRRVPIQELYVDVATDVPAGTILKYASGQIDAAYFYDDLNPDVRLTDDDFLLDAERDAARRPVGKTPAKRK